MHSTVGSALLEVERVFELTTPRVYYPCRLIGKGAYGQVFLAYSCQLRDVVAIKYLPLSAGVYERRAYVERDMLQTFRECRYIVQILDSFELPQPNGLRALCIVEELLQSDLRCILANALLPKKRIQLLLYQILCGVRAIHSANAIHRDLKPENIMLDSKWNAKICDFGLARPLTSSGPLTAYVVTRCYRAPDILTTQGTYTKAIDLWSVGCIFAELLRPNRPLFWAENDKDLFKRYCEVLGTQQVRNTMSTWPTFGWRDDMPSTSGQDWSTLFPTCPVSGLNLIARLLRCDPRARADVDTALRHPYFSDQSKLTVQS